MTGTFWDTIVVCTVTGLCIACSGVLGITDGEGAYIKGAALTIAAFRTGLGETGACLVTVGIVLFAFSTILGWEYQGEKAFEYLLGTNKHTFIYRVLFCLLVYVGATTALDIVWNFSDIANALMAVPNLICLLALSKTAADQTEQFQAVIKAERKRMEITLSGKTQVSALIDSKWTTEALFNILDNAVKYGKAGTKIEIAITELVSYVSLAIRNRSEKAISPNEYPLLFKRFYRGKSNGDVEGVGLGLYIARRILEDEKAYIQAGKTPDGRTEFVVCLYKN